MILIFDHFPSQPLRTRADALQMLGLKDPVAWDEINGRALTMLRQVRDDIRGTSDRPGRRRIAWRAGT